MNNILSHVESTDIGLLQSFENLKNICSLNFKQLPFDKYETSVFWKS